MSLWSRLFAGNPEIPEQIFNRFGRYSDSYKPPSNYDAWEEALQKFEQKKYLESYRLFFQFLRDDRVQNVRFWDEQEGIKFELFQGSKKIFGFANHQKVKAVAKIAKAKGTNSQFTERLLHQNFNLQYSRFAIDEDDNLAIIFDTYSLDGSPYKLYYALKELAINADKQDDLLLDEFKSLQQVGTDHLQFLSDSEKAIKYHFIIHQIEKTLAIANDPTTCAEYPGGVAYLLLNLVYKLDYLIKPEGYMMETLERANRLYFAKDGHTTFDKITLLREELKSLSLRSKEGFYKEMYRGISTFGITSPANHSNVVNLINNDLGNMDWYQDNGFDAIAIAIPGYIIGYSLFNYAIPKPDRELFHLYFQITEPEYFKALGSKVQYYDPQKKIFKPKSIRKSIEFIAATNRKEYNYLYPNTALLEYYSPASFAKSYLLMMVDLDLT